MGAKSIKKMGCSSVCVWVCMGGCVLCVCGCVCVCVCGGGIEKLKFLALALC